MRVDWLDDLVALLDNRSVVEAATARNISQSAFSRRIQALEDVTGIALVERASKPVRPTSVLLGHEERIRRLALEQHQLLKQMHHESRTGTQLISIACQHAITTSLGPDIINALSNLGRSHVRLRSGTLDDCDRMLMTGQADFSLIYRTAGDPLPDNTHLTEELLVADETLIPVFDTEGAEALSKQIQNRTLNIIAYPTDIFFGLVVSRDIVPELEKTCTVNTVAETGLTPAALQMSRAGLGVAWVPKSLARHELEWGTLTDLSGLLGSLEMQLIARRRDEVTSDVSDDIWRNLVQIARD